ncbi:MAG: hypothetical protein M9941_02710 [Anaerolineae bacterium]|nr:hypothetical protein [Anaerolineae bacterium]
MDTFFAVTNNTLRRFVGWSERRSPWLWRGLAVAVLILITAFNISQTTQLVNGERYFWLDDDQMIAMRYARHLAEGSGPVWNPGERVEGYTNPLWVVVMAGVHLLPISTAITSLVIKLIALALAVTVLLLSERLLRTLAPQARLAVPFLLIGLALCVDVFYWSTNGFETTLLTALFLWVVVRMVRESAESTPKVTTYLLLGLIPLVRSDAYYVWASAAILALLITPNRRRTVGYLALSLLLPLAHVLWRRVYYGAWLPNTYLLKVSGLDGTLRRGFSQWLIFVRAYAVMLAVATIGVVMLRDRRIVGLYAGFVIGSLYIFMVGDDIFKFNRFMAFIVPALFVAALMTAYQFGRNHTRARYLLYVVLAVAVIFAGGLPHPRELVSVNGGPERAIAPALLVRDFSAPDSSIAVWAAGTAPYFSERYTFDLLGKSDAVIAQLPPRPGVSVAHNKFDMDYSLSLQPDFVFTFFPSAYVDEVVAQPQSVLLDQWRNSYSFSLILSPEFAAHYYPNPVELAYLQRNNALYIHGDSAELLTLDKWQNPEVE